jgi:hypothetical protein
MSEQPGGRFELSTRALASLALFCTGAWLVPSGIALHFASHDGANKWSHLFMSIHNTASLIFVVCGVTHVILNWKVLTYYVKAQVGDYARFKRELLIAVLGVSGLVLLIALHALILH